MSPRKILFRASSLGHLMTAPQSVAQHLRTPDVDAILARTKRTDAEKEFIESLKEQSLSAGAMTFIETLVKQEIYSVDFEVSSKAMEKGLLVEDESIGLLNRVRGFNLRKNTEQRDDGVISGSCDLFNPAHERGHDLKSSWSLQTFPLLPKRCVDSLYEWQMRAYMRLWNVNTWEVNFAMVDTPEDLIGYEDPQVHRVGHIPERLRLTAWVIERDRALERLIDVKVDAARRYYSKVLEEFDRTHAIATQALAAPATEAAELAADPFTV